MLANAFAVLTVNPITSAVLAFYGALLVAGLYFVHRKFSGASRLLNSLQTDWASAESNHRTLVEHARQHVTKLNPAPPVYRPVTFDTRNQVVVMGRRGSSPTDIARACGLQEADVDVLLGMARIEK